MKTKTTTTKSGKSEKDWKNLFHTYYNLWGDYHNVIVQILQINKSRTSPSEKAKKIDTIINRLLKGHNVSDC